jgi:hypothetical protein
MRHRTALVYPIRSAGNISPLEIRQRENSGKIFKFEYDGEKIAYHSRRIAML